MGHAGGLSRYLAITSAMFGVALPHIVVLGKHGAGASPDDQIEGYFYASGVVRQCAHDDLTETRKL